MKKPAVVLMLHHVVPWLCLASAAALLLLASHTADAQDDPGFTYPQAKFSTAAATPETYNTFIDSVRAILLNTAGGQSNGIPVLRRDDDPIAQQTFLNITLVNKAGHSISLKMSVTGAHFTGYDAGKYQCLLKSAAKSATCWSEPFLGSAATLLEPAGGVVAGGDEGLGAATTTWRAKDLDDAVSSLFLFASGKAANEDLQRGVAACEMMIAGAAKFPYVQRRISDGMWADGNCGVSDVGGLDSLQARWPGLSSAIQQSHQGAFAAEVTVQRSNGESLRVDNVRRAAPLVSFLQHDKCNRAALQQVESSSAVASSKQTRMVIRSVVQDAAETMGGGGAPATCGQAEPTMHIVGAEGKCVDVPDNSYVSRTQVIIWPCHGYTNQLWTFKRDGTIRCNGMCLAASSTNVAGATVVIDDCSSVPTSRGVWEVRADGTIALKSSSFLVLAVTSSETRTGVTVEFDDAGTTGQSWTPTNDTAPMVAAIRGYRDLCLQVDRRVAAVSAAACGGGGGGVRAEWALYPDGSVRPSAALTRCLAANAAGRLVVSACNVDGSSRQRWVFRNDGTVYNSGDGQVMTVRPRCAEAGCVVSEWELVVSAAATGSPTQNWSIML